MCGGMGGGVRGGGGLMTGSSMAACTMKEAAISEVSDMLKAFRHFYEQLSWKS
jgi:hypothetical protein